jgi:iron complex outermembrane receptor protein
MKLLNSTSMLALLASVAIAGPALAQTRAATAASSETALEELVVTAQKREMNIQQAPLSITALSGETLAKDKIMTLEDLGHSAMGLSFTQNSPQALELNIRGVVNTRLTAPTADQSVSTFVDEVYVSRSGNLNSDFYDVSRVELVRGPQGVLLGKNVAGGAISVISAPPQFDTSGEIAATIGNYDLKQVTGHVTGALTPELAGRFSFQTVNHSGYARDLEHNVDLEDLDSVQARAQLLYQPADNDFRAHLIVDYAKDTSNGPNRVGMGETTCTTPAQCFAPWYNGRLQIAALRGGLSIRESYPTWPTFAGDKTPSPQAIRHESANAILKMEKDVLPEVTLTSVTGFRHGHAYTLYDQSGLGPTNPYGVAPSVLFAEPVNFIEDVDQFSQELRLTSKYTDSKFDWILGAYYQRSRVHQFNRFWGESLALASLSGESHWDDHGKTRDVAVFGQLGYEITDTLKVEAGVRYTEDQKKGTQDGIAIALGDRLHPTDTVPLTPLTAVPGFSTAYGAKWNKVTPQVTLTYMPNDTLMAYGTISVGFKGGGFQNDAPNAFAAQEPYRPESLTNYEAGYKWEFLDRKARWNTSVFYMKYTDLQVQRTDGTCLCNVISNAGAAEIKGFETEFQYAPVHWLRTWLGGSALDAKYTDYVDPVTKISYNGKFLQRTPRYQVATGAEVTTSVLGMEDALRFRLSYKYQGKLSWAPDNVQYEKPYGLLDGRITFSPPDRPWTVSVWGKNIGDKVYRTNIIDILGDAVSSFGAPRTFGAEFTARF